MKLRLRPGFKSDATRIVADLRREMQLGPLAPFDPLEAARYLGIPTYAFSQIPGSRQALVERLIASAQVSAMTIALGVHRRAIFYESARSKGRVNSDIAHELAHALLFHEMHDACATPLSETEAEAKFLAGALLIPDHVALHIATHNIGFSEACTTYGVSTPMLTYRQNVSGALIRVRRRRGPDA